MRTVSLRRTPRRVLDRLLMQPYVQRLLLPFGRELSGKRWVFVLGCYNSGTTLLADMLQRHPEFGGLPNEGAFLTDALPYPERLGWPRMWSECQQEMLVDADDCARARRIRRQWSLWVRGGGPWVVEKSVANVTRIDFLAECFPQSQFVYIVRNGYAVAAGIRKKANLKRWRNPRGFRRYPIEYCARQWAVTDRVVRKSPLFPERIHTVRYEELTANPSSVMERLWRTLGAEPVNSRGLWADMTVHEVRSPVKNMNTQSMTELDKGDVQAISEICTDELARYGYFAYE